MQSLWNLIKMSNSWVTSVAMPPKFYNDRVKIVDFFINKHFLI